MAGSFGFLIHGPTGHFFYGFLDRQIPGTAMKTVRCRRTAGLPTCYVHV